MQDVKNQIRNSKQYLNEKNQKSKKYDLEDRTLKFSKDVRDWVKNVPKSISNFEYIKQLVRSSASVGANYIEANESLGKKDFTMRIKISRKEAKESKYWLELIEVDDGSFLEEQKLKLTKEALELVMIFSAIMRKMQ